MNRETPQIAPGSLSDLDEIVALERSIEFAPHWPRQSYVRILASDLNDVTTAQRALFLARDRDRLVGFAVAVVEPRLPGCGCGDEERTAELESIAVAGGSRRAGLGRALLHAVHGWGWSEGATELRLEARESSAAVRFYRALGFEQSGRRKAYYRDPVGDALIMRLALR